MDIQVGDRVTIDCMGNVKTIIITTEQEIKQIKENVAIFTNKILKIERPKYEVVEEKKELLTKEEKAYLKDIIENVNKYSCMKVNTISFRETNNGRLVINCFNNDYCMFEMVIYEKFKNLNKSERYTLEELGLEEK